METGALEAPERDLTPDVAAVLVENHRRFLAFLERRVGSRAVAEDILQEAFVRGLARMDSLRDDQSAVSWFYQMLRNAVVDHHRRRGAANRALETYAGELAAEVHELETENMVCRCVADLAGTLKPEYADALRRIEVEGVSVKDFATEAGITRSNAAVRIFRAREALRNRVRRSCGTCADHGCLDCHCERAADGACG